MMARLGQISILLLVASFTGCFPPPEYDEVPHIKFENIEFLNFDASPDSLNLKFSFQDGDGDIGLRPSESLDPFHPYEVIFDSEDSVVTLGDTRVVPPLKSVSLGGSVSFFSDTDNRSSYNCEDYIVESFIIYETLVEDTFFIKRNEYHHNIHLEFLRKVDDRYEVIDLEELFEDIPGSQVSHCASLNFDGRIPVFDESNLGRSLSGSISYAMVSSIFSQVFGNNTFKIDFYIYDRSRHKSNVATTGDITLLSISE